MRNLFIVLVLVASAFFMVGCGAKQHAQNVLDTYEPVAVAISEAIEDNEAALAELPEGSIEGREAILAVLTDLRVSLENVNALVADARAVVDDPESSDSDVVVQGVAGVLTLLGFGGWGTMLIRNKRMIRTLTQGMTQVDPETLAALSPAVAKALHQRGVSVDG